MAAMNRRRALLGLSLAVALGANACGGGGSDASQPDPAAGDGSAPPPGAVGGDEVIAPDIRLPAPVNGLSGAIWYANGDGNLVKVAGGSSAPVVVKPLGTYRDVDSVATRVPRRGPRYLEWGRYRDDYGYDFALVQVFDHADNRAYGYHNVEGWVLTSAMSPSGRFVGVLRCPEYYNSLFRADTTNIAGLVVVDITDANNQRVTRDEYGHDGRAIDQFCWYGDDQYLYMTLDGTIVRGSAALGVAGEQVIGTFDNQGLLKSSFDVHPDGQTFLMALGGSRDARDIHLYRATGQPIARLTATGRAYAPQWSPDGNQFLWKDNGAQLCAVDACEGWGEACAAYVAPATTREASVLDAHKFEFAKVPCTALLSWSANM
jgi:hypothetical protein